MEFVVGFVAVEMHHERLWAEGADSEQNTVDRAELCIGDDHGNVRLHRVDQGEGVTIVRKRRVESAGALDEAQL